MSYLMCQSAHGQFYQGANTCIAPDCPICHPRTVTHYHVPSFQEQMGIDPQTRLAAAIERLCELLEPKRDGATTGAET